VPNAGFCGQRPRDEVVSADDHGEFVGERDASAGVVAVGNPARVIRTFEG